MTVAIRIPDGEICECGDIKAAGVEHSVSIVNHTGIAIEFVVHGPGRGVIEIRKSEKVK